MTVLLATFLMLWAVILFAPDAAAGRLLRRLLVEAPAARLSRITRGDVAAFILLLIAGGMIAFVGESDGVRMLIMGAPDVAVWITTFEVSAYLDIIVALAAAASSLRIRGAGARLIGLVARKPKSGARRRDVRSRKPTKPVARNDDERSTIRLAA